MQVSTAGVVVLERMLMNVLFSVLIKLPTFGTVVCLDHNSGPAEILCAGLHGQPSVEGGSRSW